MSLPDSHNSHITAEREAAVEERVKECMHTHRRALLSSVPQKARSVARQCGQTPRGGAGQGHSQRSPVHASYGMSGQGH